MPPLLSSPSPFSSSGAPLNATWRAVVLVLAAGAGGAFAQPVLKPWTGKATPALSGVDLAGKAASFW
jgi:hypothetical protein